MKDFFEPIEILIDTNGDICYFETISGYRQWREYEDGKCFHFYDNEGCHFWFNYDLDSGRMIESYMTRK